MNRRRSARAARTTCSRCGGSLADVIKLDGGDRKGCPLCEPDLLRINFTHANAEPTPVYLERKPAPTSGDGPPCPRCERSLSAPSCSGCGYPAAAPPAKRRRRRTARP